MKKKYIVRLSSEERLECQEVIKKLKGSSNKVRRAHMLLKADVNGPSWTDAKIAEAFDARTRTVEKLRERLVVEGFQIALHGKKRETPPTPHKLDGEGGCSGPIELDTWYNKNSVQEKEATNEYS